MKVLVCGGRNYGNLKGLKRDTPEWDAKYLEVRHVLSTLDQFAIKHSRHYDPIDNWLPLDIEIIAGGASGADACAIDWAVVSWCNFYEVPAKWELYGRKAGFLRNEEMLLLAPDYVIAFPGGNGTAHMVKIAKKAGIPVIEVPPLKP